MQRIPFTPSSFAALAAAAALATAAPAQLPDHILTNLIVEDQLVANPPPVGGAVLDLDVTPDGSRLVFGTVGVVLEDCVGGTEGAFYVYDYDPGTGTWHLDQAVKNCEFKHFGRGVSISDDGTVICVGHGAEGFQNNGRVWIYREVDGTWVEDATFYDPGASLGAIGAIDLDPTGTRAIMVAPEQLGSYFQIVHEVDGAWQVELNVSWVPFELNYLYNTAIDGAWAAVGTVRTPPGEPAYEGIDMYHYDGSSWQLAQVVVPPSGYPLAAPGDLEIDGTTMIVGRDPGFGAAGYVGIYELDAKTGQWGQVFEQMDTPGLGHDVDIQGDEAVAAVRGGSLYTNLYRRVDGVWQLDAALDMPNWTFLNQALAAAIGGGRFFGGGAMTVNVQRAIVEEYDVPRVICTLEEDFDGLSEVPPSLFAYPRSCATQGVTGGELVLDLPPACSGGNNANLALGDVIVGDFDLSADWCVDALPPIPAVTLGSGLTILGLDNLVVARLERFRLGGTGCAPSNDVYKAWDSIGGSGNCASSIVATTQLAGSFRVQREGTTWTLSFRDAVNPEWVPLRTATLTDAPVRFALEQWTNASSADMTTCFDNLALASLEPATGTCCLPDTACLELACPEACAAMGGSFEPGGVCAGTECPVVPGPCCFEEDYEDDDDLDVYTLDGPGDALIVDGPYTPGNRVLRLRNQVGASRPVNTLAVPFQVGWRGDVPVPTLMPHELEVSLDGTVLGTLSEGQIGSGALSPQVLAVTSPALLGLANVPLRFAWQPVGGGVAGAGDPPTLLIDDIVFEVLPPPACPGDTDGDGFVDVNDLNHVILDWGTDGSANGGDLTGQTPGSPPDGFVDVNDLNAVIVGWGACP